MARILIVSIAIIPCVILLLPAIVVIALLSWFVSAVHAIARRIERTHIPWTDLIEFDQQLGWKPRPNLDTYYLAADDDVFRIVTDREGWPGVTTIEESEVIVIGDSFAFGYGIDTNRSFASLMGDVSVKAVAAPGYSMVHCVRLMEQLGERLRGKLIIWFTFLENDLQDNIAPEMSGYRAPFVRRDPDSGTWEIFDRHVSPTKWDCSLSDARRLFPSFCVPGPAAERAYDASDFLIQRAQLACERVAAHLVVVTIPHSMQLTDSGRREMAALSGAPSAFDADLPDRRIGESCRRWGVSLVLGMQHLSSAHYKRREGIHWNQSGHREIARLLKRLHASFSAGRLNGLSRESAHREPSLRHGPNVRVAIGPPSALRDRTGTDHR
jgi:hypothetical protein